MSRTAYVFTVPDKRLREMDVATGPCVPTGGRKRPLRGPVMQDHGEGPQQTAAFYMVLTGRPSDEAMTLLETKGPGALYAFTNAYVDALVDEQGHLEALANEDEANRDSKDLPLFAHRLEELSLAWIATGVWPKDVVGTNGRFRMGVAAYASSKGQRVFAWYGPSVETYRVVSGRFASPGKG